jgi:hypothetical protein
MPPRPSTASTEERPWTPCANPGRPALFDARGYGTGVGRPRRFCSDACKQAAHRVRHCMADYPQTTDKEVIIEG